MTACCDVAAPYHFGALGLSPCTQSKAPPFAVVYEKYFDLVWATVHRLGVDKDAVDDVVQEVFVVIHARLGELRQVESLRSWVYGVARRTASSYRRKWRSGRAVDTRYAEVASWLVPPPPTPHELSVMAERQRLLLEVMSQLGERKREVFVLAEIEGFTAPEIARALQLSPNTVSSRLRAARQAFERVLKGCKARKMSGAE